MRCVIFLSGSIVDDLPVLDLARTASLLICADGGVAHARRMGLIPNLLVGDLDSVTDADLAWIRAERVPVRQFPCDKDETDAELAILAAVEQLSELGSPAQRHEIVLAGALGDRPDHVLGTQLLACRMAAKLAAQDCRFILTDGSCTLYTLCSGQILDLDLHQHTEKQWLVSVIPISSVVRGLSNTGLAYPLSGAELPLGSTRGLSNRVSGTPVRISLDEGVALVIVLPE
jgi:thiamine pyrophosphokinase